ncbi:hypothetical protein [Streptomyces fuscichromogenes]|uniref:Uncharacterized protein n=1 Tax=Streptomyces fuscichromogenes TaxID=1324013 RepID=A0A917XJH5_9ACTN|nr:hypothetical protein [Streptomyces fuscichromogenes]GGN32001.1 hypothetical protein GCM10011578_070360 [Streptomyces fuscichromogenes]
MAMVTVHQWPDVVAGLRELRRVARGPVVVLTFDGDELARLWPRDSAPGLRPRTPPPDSAAPRPPATRPSTSSPARSAPATQVRPVPIPIDCVDGFTEAYHARPESFLEPAVRRARSAWTFLEPGAEECAVDKARRRPRLRCVGRTVRAPADPAGVPRSGSAGRQPLNLTPRPGRT